MEKRFLAHPVIAHVIPMIRCHHDQRILHAAAAFKVIKQDAHLIIALLDQTHIGTQHFLAYIITRKGLADWGPLHRDIRGMAGLFRVRPIWGDEMFGAVHAGVGFGHDIGPMWFDIRQVTAPRLFTPRFNKFDAAAGQIGCFAVIFCNVCRSVRIREKPA